MRTKHFGLKVGRLENQIIKKSEDILLFINNYNLFSKVIVPRAYPYIIENIFLYLNWREKKSKTNGLIINNRLTSSSANNSFILDSDIAKSLWADMLLNSLVKIIYIWRFIHYYGKIYNDTTRSV